MASWKTAFFPTSRLSLNTKKNLKHLDTRKSVGVDGIFPRVLSLSAPAKAEEVVKLINKIYWETRLDIGIEKNQCLAYFQKQ